MENYTDETIIPVDLVQIESDPAFITLRPGPTLALLCSILTGLSSTEPQGMLLIRHK